MRDAFPFLEVLTLPTDAGPTADRIVIDGINGAITGYDGSDVVFHIDAQAGSRGIWSTDFAASTDPADLDIAAHVQLDGDTIRLSEGGAVKDALIAASNINGLRLDGYVQSAGDSSLITLRCTELRMSTTGQGGAAGAGPIITISETTDGFGTATFNHGQESTPQIILPIAESPAGMTVHNIDNYGATTARIVTDQASTAITVRALAIT